MNGPKSPDASAAPSPGAEKAQNGSITANGHRSPPVAKSAEVSPPLHAADEGDSASLPDASHISGSHGRITSHGDADDAASEAETLISSPVKRRELEKQQQNGVKIEQTDQDNLPDMSAPADYSPIPDDVPTPGGDIMDDDADADGSSDNGVAAAAASPVAKTGERIDGDNDDDSNSEPLSDVSSRSSSPIQASSRASSRSRAYSERPKMVRNGTESPNPRKRKHRASSVSLPNKRQSMEASKRKLRNLHSEEQAVRTSAERSPSPRLRSHRRTTSTQSAFMDGSAEGGGSRKRRAVTQFPVQGPSSVKGWEESDASSESTSHDHVEFKRPTRGVGRATSTPGRGPGREHKRYVSKYGFTRMAEACEAGELDAVKEWREKDPDQLELAEFAGNTPLQIAALNGNAEIVEYLITQGVRVDTSNTDKDTPLLDASENGHLEVVEALLKAGVDPLRTNKVGQAALDVVHDDTDNADEIRAALRDAISAWNSDGAKQRREGEEARFGAGPSKGLHFMARSYDNLLKLVQDNDRNGVREFLDARVPVDNAVVAAAAKTGDLYLVNMLLAEITEKKKWQKPEKPMLAVLGTSHFEMVKSLTMLEQFNASYESRSGKSWPELAEERQGPNWRNEKELLQVLRDEKEKQKKARRSSSPVTKRDGGKRTTKRQVLDEDSGEEHAPKPKNGRRLMSRKAMRAAVGRGQSASSDDESNTDAPGSPDPAAETSMRPPNSPPSKRGAGRQRTKSLSAQGSDTSTMTRRRSSSLRGETDRALPSLEEADEKAEFDTKEDTMEDVITGKAAREAEAKFALEQAQHLEAIRKETEEAEAEARKKEEEAEAERAEEARNAEEERRAEDARKAEAAAAAAREQEERERKRLAEEARQAEENRRKEAEFAEAKQRFRQELVASLPSAISYVLDPKSGFEYEAHEAFEYLTRHLTPLQAVQHVSSSDEPYVLNLQAAPLTGEQGWELLIPDSSPFAVGTLQRKLSSLPCSPAYAQQIISRWQPHLLCRPPEDEDMEDAELPYSEELKRTAERANAFRKSQRQALNNDRIALRWFKLRDVLGSLHPSLTPTAIEVDVSGQFPSIGLRTPPADAAVAVDGSELKPQHAGTAVSRQTWLDGKVVRDDTADTLPLRTSMISIAHEK